MKSKIILMFVFNLAVYGFSFCQNAGGGENPDSLSFTFADTTQNLQVNGSMVVDSSLTVKDSVVMEDNLHIYEKLQLEKDAHLKKDVYVGNEIKVEGDVYLMKNVYIQENLKVEGNTILQNNAKIRKKLNVEGNAIFEKNALIEKELKVNGESNLVGVATFYNKINFLNISDIDPVLFNNSADSTNQNIVPKILFVDQNGEVKKGDSDILKSIIYTGKFCNETIGSDGLPILVTNPADPTWANGPNKLFLAECPSLARVGIGTSNPRVKLDVIGRTSVTHLAIGADPESQTALFHLKATNLAVTDESTLFIAENNQRKLMQLNNQGLLHVREVKVNLDSWPDYVFEPNYNLRPLSEVKKFIDENKHLPNVPSAKEIEEKGLNLGEGNKILLEKVEEMTLYMIQLEENLVRQGELLKAQGELLKIQQQQIDLMQTKN